MFYPIAHSRLWLDPVGFCSCNGTFLTKKGPHRLQPAQAMSFWAVMAEPLLLNQCVPDPREPASLLSGSSVIGRVLRDMGVVRLHHLRQAILAPGHPQ